MARSFAGSDYITYSNVPTVAGLSQLSFVARLSCDSGCADYGQAFTLASSGNQNNVAMYREPGTNRMGVALRNWSQTADFQQFYFPFTHNSVIRSVVCSFDGGASPKTIVYVDGSSQTLSGAVPTNTTIGSGQTALTVGGITGYRYSGAIAELAIYNRVITPAEALIHAAGYSCRNFQRGLIFYAPLIREVHDIAGGLTGTITGTTVSDHPRIYA